MTTDLCMASAPTQPTVLSNIPGTPGMFWGDHSTYIGTFVPPDWLAGLAGRGRAFNIMGLVSALRLLGRRRYHPGVVTDGGASGLLFACMQAAIPWGRKPHILIDCLWYRSENRFWMALKRVARRVAARSGARFVVWASHEVEDYARAFGIPREQFVYVPHYYSLDGYDYTIRDDGYLFAGGDGDRDYRTLVEAVRPLEIPCWIATRNREALRGVAIPPQVRVEGTTPAGFRQAMAGSRLVVVAMQGGHLHSGGQQTCLNAMMMGKPTIAVGRRWAVDLISPGEDGLIVDYEDVEGLRSAIRSLWQEPQRAVAMGARARAKAAHLPSQRAMATIYNRVLHWDSSRA
jgi:glycosyltransferase involved in cell wall biosynthesis